MPQKIILQPLIQEKFSWFGIPSKTYHVVQSQEYFDLLDKKSAKILERLQK